MASVGCSFETVEALFAAEHDRLVVALAVAFDPTSAEDAVQEAFVAADRRWRTVRTLEDPAGWVRRVAINRLLNGRRDRRRRAEILELVRAPSADDLTDDLLDLRSVLMQLPDRMRTVTCLYYLADLSVDEVAAALDISAGTVKSTLHDARARMRSSLKDTRHV
jgi:RNA polymerase sigma factor (sigma-70 family)